MTIFTQIKGLNFEPIAALRRAMPN